MAFSLKFLHSHGSKRHLRIPMGLLEQFRNVKLQVHARGTHRKFSKFFVSTLENCLSAHLIDWPEVTCSHSLAPATPGGKLRRSKVFPILGERFTTRALVFTSIWNWRMFLVSRMHCPGGTLQATDSEAPERVADARCDSCHESAHPCRCQMNNQPFIYSLTSACVHVLTPLW